MRALRGTAKIQCAVAPEKGIDDDELKELMADEMKMKAKSLTTKDIFFEWYEEEIEFRTKP